MDSNKVNSILKRYKEDLIYSGTNELGDYELGFIHGLEYALAVHEHRPVIYVNADRSFSVHDLLKFPEYFI